MIQLRPDCLLIQMSTGESIPCPAETVTAELIGDAASWMNPELIKNASAAVLHFFKEEQGRNAVSVAEFSSVLEKILCGFGFTICSANEPDALTDQQVTQADVSKFLDGTDSELELAFYPKLRGEMKRLLQSAPSVVWLCGLRICVKRLLGARRWSNRCQRLNDQIVGFIRECLDSDSKNNCLLGIRG